MSAGDWDDTVRAVRNLHRVDEAVAACERLDRLADASRTSALYALLDDDEFFVREAAATPLARLEGIRALPALFRAATRGELDGHDNDGLTATICDLLEAEAGAAAPLLLEMLTSADAATRANGAWALGFVVPHAPADRLVESLCSDCDARVRSSAAGSLSSFTRTAGVYEALSTALDDPDESVRISAIASLGYLGDRRAIDVLSNRSGGATENERRMIAHALATLGRQ
jgi:HEAT repeat protein